MAIFLGVHEFGERLTQEKMDENWAKYSNSCKEHGAQAHKVFYNLAEGKSWCITEAESADAVNEAHNAVELPTKQLFEVSKFSK
jgi:uncharacterized protein YaaR (DUF327 family)